MLSKRTGNNAERGRVNREKGSGPHVRSCSSAVGAESRVMGENVVMMTLRSLARRTVERDDVLGRRWRLLCRRGGTSRLEVACRRRARLDRCGSDIRVPGAGKRVGVSERTIDQGRALMRDERSSGRCRGSLRCRGRRSGSSTTWDASTGGRRGRRLGRPQSRSKLVLARRASGSVCGHGGADLGSLRQARSCTGTPSRGGRCPPGRQGRSGLNHVAGPDHRELPVSQSFRINFTD
jgi:hypothetical protein